MQDISKGTLLGNRYELTSATSETPDVSRWIARDEKLGRDVALTIFRNDFVNADAALDSARRVAGLEDHRIVRVLDAGQDEVYAYIVEEPHLGAHSLADLVRFDQLHPEEARRIAGEVAAALEAARQRGLHHLQLDPRKILRLADGSIVMRDLAVAAALAGEDDVSSTEANSIDAQAVVQILYFALTRTWAGKSIDDEKIKPAERRADGQLATPAEVLDNAPGDLDALCRQSLNHAETPRTPGEIATLLSPWPSQMITAPGRAKKPVTTSDDDTDTFTLRKAASKGSSAARAGVGAVGAAAMAGAAKVAAKKQGSSRQEPATASDDDTQYVDISAGANAAGLSTGRKPQVDPDETSQYTLDDEDAAYSRTSYDPSFEELEPPLPGMSSGLDDPDSSASKLALAIVALCVLLALVLAVLGLRNIMNSPSPSAPGNSQTAAAPNPTQSSGNKPSPSKSSSSSKPAAGSDVSVSNASIVSSSGRQVRDSDFTFRAIDGNPQTEWKSLFYLNKPWGGYPDRGGLAVTLPGQTKVKSVTIEPGEFPLTADVYVGDTPGTSGTKIGSVSNATSQQVVQADGAEGRYVTVYVTDMTQTPDKHYRSSIAELTVQK